VREVCEVAERAVVDAEHRRAVVADHPRRRDHRPVAAEHDDEVNALDQLRVLQSLDGAARLRLNLRAVEARPADDLDAAHGAPLDQAADGLERIRLVRLDENPDASDGNLLHE
jgi:hypothetical protein